MSLLLAADPVSLYPPGGTDSHGWAETGAVPSWTGTGNLQPGPGRSDPRAAEGGGHGPYEPHSGGAGVLYLPPEAPVADGVVAVVGTHSYVLAQTRLVADPTGGGLDCWAASFAGTNTWGQ